jgi:polysaccharide biosynthesis protein PslH
MKILWIKTDFLHPTTRGGQIRTLEMLKPLHRRHEIHYVGFENPAEPEGVARSGEYSTRAYPVTHRPPAKNSLAFAGQLARGLFSPIPVAIERWHSPAMERVVSDLITREPFDSIICDFLAPAPNLGARINDAVVFQHNVESEIWRRHAEHAPDPFRRAYFRTQARRMFAFEKEICSRARRVVAVSEQDAKSIREMFGIPRVDVVPTGVDVEYFHPPAERAKKFDLVFVGSMDWMPNQDGVRFFLREILPLVRARRTGLKLAIVGRTPPDDFIEAARRDSAITVTGTVPDVRPFLWESTASIVPLRIGGGTRLKIFESMAAGTPVISTAVGAEGLEVRDGENILIADTPETFAGACLKLIENGGPIAEAGRRLVVEKYSWDAASAQFEKILLENAKAGAAR